MAKNSKRILIIYPPFCTPTSPTYSIYYLSSFLKDFSDHLVESVDLNLLFHQTSIDNPFRGYDDYENKAKGFHKDCGKLYKQANKALRAGKPLPHLDMLIDRIRSFSPDVLVFSCVFFQQTFYAIKIAKHFRNSAKTVVGGPAISPKLEKHFDLVTNDFVRFSEFLGFQIQHRPVNIDYRILDNHDYYSRRMILPIRSSFGCRYGQCAFCNMHNSHQYYEFEPDAFADHIRPKSLYQFVDNIIPIKRLAGFSQIFKDKDIRYYAYSRVEPDPDPESFRQAYESGCRVIMWGVESGSQKMLDLMDKGIRLDWIKNTLKASADAGIKNIIYIIVGYPGETEETLKETLRFLGSIKEHIHIVAPNIFSVQPGSKVFIDPDRYGIKVVKNKRALLPDTFTYKPARPGILSGKEIKELKGKYKKKLSSLNKYPFMFSVYKDHFLDYVS